MADSRKRRQHNQKSKAHFPPACKTEAKWMFAHLDLNNDGILSIQELYDLEHDQNERCIKPFIDTCDLDHDNVLNTREWCRCFEKTDRPCTAVVRRIRGDFAGEIGSDIFFLPLYLLSSVKDCGNCNYFMMVMMMNTAGLLLEAIFSTFLARANLD